MTFTVDEHRDARDSGDVRRSMIRPGDVFGDWLTLSRSDRKKSGRYPWLCRCTCGVEREVLPTNLLSGISRSCGHGRVAALVANSTKHGGARVGGRDPEYLIWCAMRKRCMNPRDKDYASYGGRGIRVCEQWDSYERFIADVGRRPEGGRGGRSSWSLDRIDVNGNYEPGNVRWADLRTQADNRRKDSFRKLDDQDRVNIKSRLERGERPSAIARQFGVSASALSKINSTVSAVEEDALPLRLGPAPVRPGVAPKPARLPRGSLVGARFNRLAVVAFVGKAGAASVWLCRCDCGSERHVRGGNLRSGHTQSCGCLAREIVTARSSSHGAARRGQKSPPEYVVWAQMKSRCLWSGNKQWAAYGERGIRVCERWLGKDGFAKFLADLGPRPSRRHTLDRIDNDGHYEPGNCRWATYAEQMRNTRATKITTTDLDVIDQLARAGRSNQEIAERFGVTRHHISRVLNRGVHAHVS